MTQDTAANGQTSQALAPLTPHQIRAMELREGIGQDTTPRAIVPSTFAEAQAFAMAISQSSLVPVALQNRAPDILMIVLAGAEQGIAPIRSLSLFHVIEGVPKLSADGLAGKIMSSPLCEYLEPCEQTASRVSWRGKRKGRPELVVSYSIEEANAAGLLGKTNWRKHPQDMLNARCKARLCRLIWPDLAAGITTAEEALDMLEGPTTGTSFPAGPTATTTPLVAPDRQGPPPGVPDHRKQITPDAIARSGEPEGNAKAAAKPKSNKAKPIDTTATESTSTSPSSSGASSNGNASTPASDTGGSQNTSGSSTQPSSTSSSESSRASDTAPDATASSSPETQSQPSVPAEDSSGFGDDEEDAETEATNVRTIERFEREIAATTILAKPAAASELARLKGDWLPWSKDETPAGGKAHAQRMRQVFGAAQKAIEAK